MPSPSEEVVNGEEAKRILNSPVFNDALDKLEDRIMAQLAKTEIVGDNATVKQQQMIMLLQSANMFRKIIRETIDTGKLANEQLLREKRGLFR